MENNIVDLCTENGPNMCRLCSVEGDLLDLFAPKNANLSMRILILLATGIEIKESDIVSKMVCHRCCEIAVKLHKYRTNAVSNDKLLKEQNGLPYAPPITDQNELLRVALKIANEHKDACNGASVTTHNSNLHSDPLELLNLSLKKEITYPAHDIASHNNKPSDLKQVVKSSVIRFQKVEYKHSSVQRVFKIYRGIVLPQEVFKSDISPVISLDRAEVSDWYAEQLSALKSKLKNITFKAVPRNLNHSSHLSIPSERSSVTLPERSITSASKHTAIVPKSSVVTPSKCNTITVTKSSAVTSSEHSAVTSSEHSAVTSPFKRYKAMRSHPRIIDTNGSDSDGVDRDEFQPFNGLMEQENDISQTNLVANLPPTKQTSIVPNNINSCLPTNQQVATLHNYVKPHNQSARKRTARRFGAKRKRTSSKNSNKNNEKKKKKDDCNESSLAVPNEIPLPEKCSSDKTEQEIICTPPLNLLCNETLPELFEGKALEVFMCPICNKLYDTKKELVEHEKTHLKCKFCKKRVRNLERLHKHQTESCFISIVKNQPIIKLRKVDTIPSITKEYGEAFQESDTDEQNEFTVDSNYSESVDNNETHPNIEEVVLPMPFDNPFIVEQETAINTNSIPANSEHNSEVVCISISDDSGDEVECTEIIRHKIVDNPYTIPPNETVVPSSNESQNVTVDLTLDNKLPTISDNLKSNSTSPTRSILREKEMIRSLFKKHSNSSVKCQRDSQTFIPSNCNIKYTNTNLIILDNMFPELSAYKIPVNLEAQPRISARFKEEVTVREPPASLECWAFKKSIDVEKRVAACTNRTSSTMVSNNAVVLNVVNTPSTTSRTLSSYSNLSDPRLVRKPVILKRPTSNVTMAVARTTFNTANATPVPVSSTSTTDLYNSISLQSLLASNSTASFTNSKSRNNVVQIVEPSNTAQYQASVAPRSSASAVLGVHQDRDNTHRPEKVLHISHNITNLNKIYVLAPTQQLPQEISNARYETSYLNNICANVSQSFKQSAQICEVETANQELSVVPYNANNQTTENSNSMLRVKNISELN